MLLQHRKNIYICTMSNTFRNIYNIFIPDDNGFRKETL